MEVLFEALFRIVFGVAAAVFTMIVDLVVAGIQRVSGHKPSKTWPYYRGELVSLLLPLLFMLGLALFLSTNPSEEAGILAIAFLLGLLILYPVVVIVVHFLLFRHLDSDHLSQ